MNGRPVVVASSVIDLACPSRCLGPNNAMNLTVRPVTRLADSPARIPTKGDGQGACPSRPAGYGGRYAYNPIWKKQLKVGALR